MFEFNKETCNTIFQAQLLTNGITCILNVDLTDEFVAVYDTNFLRIYFYRNEEEYFSCQIEYLDKNVQQKVNIKFDMDSELLKARLVIMTCNNLVGILGV